MMQRQRRHPNAHRHGFTLLEALVAVVGVAILSVGIATVFSAISKTVTTGRRVSAINNYASVIERVLREDFEKMTREGFLVIRNEYALNPVGMDPVEYQRNPRGVLLSPDTPLSGRARRIDEVMFFTRGQYVSARNPLDGNFVPHANSARIYYGHGQQYSEGAIGFATPFLEETNEETFDTGPLRHGLSAINPNIGETNPNFYAGDWTLLRGVTLLSTPQPHPVGTAGPLGLSSTNAAQLRKFQDNNLQIDGLPAAGGVFRVETIIGRPIADFSMDAGTDNSFDGYNLRSEVVSPLFESGLVDVATTSLTDIKRRVTTIYGKKSILSPSTDLEIFAGTPDEIYSLRDTPADWPAFNPNIADLFTLSPRQLMDFRLGLQGESYTPGFGFIPSTPLAETMGTNDDVTGMQLLVNMQHAWMSDALPGRSNEIAWRGDGQFDLNPSYSRRWRGVNSRSLPSNAGSPYGRGSYERTDMRVRMRYEVTPPGYNADVFSPDAATGTTTVLQAAYRADQQQISASQFIPRCSEFIVEWSLGHRDDAGNVIWYGHDADALFAPQRAGAVQRLRPEGTRPSFGPSEIYREEKQRNIERHLLADLVNGLITETGTTDARRLEELPINYPLTHYFGYADPRAVPLDGDGDGFADAYDMNDDGIADDIDGDGVNDDSWPWPKLIRITMSFADPIDQSIEETFQFEIEIPDGSGI